MIGLSTLMFNFPSSILLQFKILSIVYVIHEKKPLSSFFRAFSQAKNANRKEFYFQITLDHRDFWVFFIHSSSVTVSHCVLAEFLILKEYLIYINGNIRGTNRIQ